MAQLVKRLTSAQVTIPWFLSLRPALGCDSSSLEPASDSLSPSCSSESHTQSRDIKAFLSRKQLYLCQHGLSRLRPKRLSPERSGGLPFVQFLLLCLPYMAAYSLNGSLYYGGACAHSQVVFPYLEVFTTSLREGLYHTLSLPLSHLYSLSKMNKHLKKFKSN